MPLPKLVLVSWGRKSGKPEPKADLHIDCRGLAEAGILGVGSDLSFQKELEKQSQDSIGAIYTLIVDSLQRIPRRRRDRPDPYADPYVVCFACAWGVHRSVATKHIMAHRLKALGLEVTIQ